MRCQKTLDVRRPSGDLRLSPSLTCSPAAPAKFKEAFTTQRSEEEPEVSGTHPHQLPLRPLNFRPLGLLRLGREGTFPVLGQPGPCRLSDAVRASLWGAVRGLWARPARGPARRHRSCGGLPVEELFARGGPLRTFLERQAESQSQLQAPRGPELLAVAKLLSEKERELRETEPLLHDENEDLRKLAENEIASCQKEIAQLKHQIILLLVPSEETDENDLILEVTAGVGGQEAMLESKESSKNNSGSVSDGHELTVAKLEQSLLLGSKDKQENSAFGKSE
ncbi:LOW QUALITY PROTEIN: peptide chain release factor 1-like, mitochondrial [Myotis lucifugus]|uniref:LOW QUALITY PROTEIN: peptide chain release factor 1-like, mitochondrial n=1 Tax=Myotis lucifugus TaxID=59463 RepID=UPI000CCC7985|nr:LOW QUALITY PROTEIN: peptide chain release factor 1-like, mitochondrial [Myotis lucifugus]